MARLICRLRRIWAAIWVPAVLDDGELMHLLAITASDLGAIRTEADARAKPGSGCYWLDRKGRRLWLLRQTLPLACRTLRGLR